MGNRISKAVPSQPIRPLARPTVAADNTRVVSPSAPILTRPQARPAGDRSTALAPASHPSSPVSVQFTAADQTVASLRQDFVSNRRVGISQMAALDRRVDQILSNPAQRAALIDRYDLDSEANKLALMAVGTMESGGNGDMAETMTVTMNRALTQNLMREITGRQEAKPISIRQIVNQPNQYESSTRVNAVLDNKKTHQNWNAYRAEAAGLANQIIAGESRFSNNASTSYYFKQGSSGFGNAVDFSIGKHSFNDTLNGMHYVQDALQMASGINHNH